MAREFAPRGGGLDGRPAVPRPRGGLRVRRAARAATATRSRRAAARRRSGLDLAPVEYEEHFAEQQVPHSTALHSRLRDGELPTSSDRSRATRSTATRLSPVAPRGGRRGRPRARRAATRSAASSCAAVEILLRPRRGAAAARRPTSRPTRPRSRWRRARASGYGWSEAPRGLLWHRYEIDDARHDPRRQDRPADLAEPGRASRRACTASSRATSTSPTTSCASAASRRSAATTRASPARPTSCALEVDRG